MSEIREYIVLNIAIISYVFFWIGKRQEKVNQDPRDIRYGMKEHPDRIFGINFLTYMGVTALVAAIFCIWATLIYVPRIVDWIFMM